MVVQFLLLALVMVLTVVAAVVAVIQDFVVLAMEMVVAVA